MVRPLQSKARSRHGRRAAGRPNRCGERAVRVLCVTLTVLFGCQARHSEVALTGQTMGTTYSVKVVTTDRRIAGVLSGLIEAQLARIDAVMSTWRSDSELAAFNARAGTDWVPISRELGEVVATALRVSAQTGGAFDVTIAPLVNLWGFGWEGLRTLPPEAAEIAAARASVGYGNLELHPDGNALRKRLPGLTIDVSAIVPGYAADVIAAQLVARGITDFVVDIGGEIRAQGHNAAGRPWRIGIERPDPEARAVEVVLELTHGAIATSGVYREFFEFDGTRYSHALDPRSGMPVRHTLASVTVLADSAMTADALATALLVLGAEQGMALAGELEIAALFLTVNGGEVTRTATPAFRATNFGSP